MMHWGSYGVGMGFGWIFMVLFWALVILGIVYVVQARSRRVGHAGPAESALDILKRRYAEGELTREEFARMKDDLMKK